MGYQGISAFVSAFVAVAALAGAANATTIGFDGDSSADGSYAESGFSFSDLRIVNGNCLNGACAALNDNEAFTMSLASGEAFDLNSLSFQLLGHGSKKGGGNMLTITADNAETISVSTNDFSKNDFHTLNFGSAYFKDVRYLTFSTRDGGNVRLDAFEAASTETASLVSEVPLPATIWLSAAALGGLGVMRRRKKLR